MKTTKSFPKEFVFAKCLALGLGLVAALAGPTAARAQVTLTIGDTLGNSSFNTAGGWSDALAPHSGTNYLVDNGLTLRTPASGSSFTFGGDSLTIGSNGVNGAGFPGADFGYKGTGGTGIITIANLVMKGGLIRAINGIGDNFQLAGNLNMAADSTIYAKQGPINIMSIISGSGNITNPGSDGVGRTLIILTNVNTYTGSIINNGRFQLATNANLNFVIGASNVNNSVSGTGAQTTFDGNFVFDLSGASTTLGSSWTIASASGQTFGGAFTVVGFTLQGAGLWDLSTNSVIYEFDTSTGTLKVVPPPPPTVTWNGLGSDNNWTSNANWTNSFGPSLTGSNNTLFAGATRPTPTMNANYTLTAVIFDSTATNFTIGTASSTLTLVGGVANNSTNAQALNVPITMGAAITLNAAVGNLSLGQTINNGGNLLTVNGVSNTTLSAAVSGTGRLTKQGTGALTLAVGNSHSGGTTLSAGQLNINNATALGAAAGTFTIAGGAIDNTSGGNITVANNNPQIWSNNFTYVGSVTNLNLGTGAVTLGANVQVTVSSNSLTEGGVISGSFGLIKAGAGTLTLSALNDFTGNMSIAAGTLVVTTIGDIFAPGGVGAGLRINFGSLGPNTGRLLYIGTGEETFKIISLSSSGGSGIIDQSGTGLLKFSGDSVADGPTSHPLTLQGSGTGTGEVAGAIVNNSAVNRTSVIKAGTGVWVLSGANTYTGDTTINGGTLVVPSDGLIATSSNITVASGATLDVSGGGITIVAGQTLAGSGTVTGAVTIADGATLSPGTSPGTLTVNGNLVLNNSSTLAYELGTSSDQTVVNGNLTLDGTVNVTDSGGLAAGNFTLISYAGSLTDNGLNVGTLPVGFSGTVSNDTVNKRVVLALTGGADPFGTWQIQFFGCTGCTQAQGGADPDGDGMINTNEFLAAFNPTNNNAYVHITSVVKSGNNLNITYLGANGDSTRTPAIASRTNVLEFTTGTVNGSYTNNFESTGQTNILSGGTGVGVVTSFVETNGATFAPSRYYRVRVLVP